MSVPKRNVNFISLVKSKYIKIHQQGIPSIGCNLLEFFCMHLHTDYLSDLYKKLLVASTDDTHVEYKN